MKIRFFYTMLLMLSFSLVSSSCSSDDDNQSPDDNSVIIGEIATTVQSGEWRITSFVDSGNDETSHFNGYNFSFNANGSLIADNGTNTITGSWSITNDDSNDDSNSSNDIDFNIAFSSPADFSELTEDWHIVSRSSTRLELIHVSGGNGGTDTLVFELN